MFDFTNTNTVAAAAPRAAGANKRNERIYITVAHVPSSTSHDSSMNQPTMIIMAAPPPIGMVQKSTSAGENDPEGVAAAGDPPVNKSTFVRRLAAHMTNNRGVQALSNLWAASLRGRLSAEVQTRAAQGTRGQATTGNASTRRRTYTHSSAASSADSAEFLGDMVLDVDDRRQPDDQYREHDQQYKYADDAIDHDNTSVMESVLYSVVEDYDIASVEFSGAYYSKGAHDQSHAAHNTVRSYPAYIYVSAGASSAGDAGWSHVRRVSTHSRAHGSSTSSKTSATSYTSTASFHHNYTLASVMRNDELCRQQDEILRDMGLLASHTPNSSNSSSSMVGSSSVYSHGASQYGNNTSGKTAEGSSCQGAHDHAHLDVAAAPAGCCTYAAFRRPTVIIPRKASGARKLS